MLETIKKMLLLGDSDTIALVLSILANNRIGDLSDAQVVMMKDILAKAKTIR